MKNGIIYNKEGKCVEYWVAGLLHRKDGPAVQYDDGDEEWWLHGNRHREDGPALTAGEIQIWMQHGKCHRIDGPAVINKSTDGIDTYEYWIRNKKYSYDEFKFWSRAIGE